MVSFEIKFKLSIEQARLSSHGITSESLVHFNDSVPIQKPGEPAMARLSHVLDIAPMNVSDVSPMALVVEVSSKIIAEISTVEIQP